MLVPISLLVVSTRKISFMWEWVAVALGVGIVERNIVLFTMILKLENDAKMRKIIIMDYVVVKNLDLRRRITAQVVIVDIVVRGGKKLIPGVRVNHLSKGK